MNKFTKSVLSVSAAAIVATTSMAPALVYAWGDNSGSADGRPLYTLDDINADKLGNTITFNSIYKDSKIGDERNFVGARLTSGNSAYYNANEIDVEDGQIYTIRLFVHNNNPWEEKNTAEGVSILYSLPSTVAKQHTIIGYINSTNAKPTRYWDEVVLKSADDFYIEYVKGSAQYRTEKGTFTLSDNVIHENTLIGYDSMNGKIPGCFKYSGEATIQVKVHKSVNAKLAKTVRIKGSGEKFAESVEAKIGDEVEFQIEYVNLLADMVKNVMIRDILPNNLQYVENSTYLYNSNYKTGKLLPENTLTTEAGLNIGSYNSRGNAYVRFTAKVVDKSMACGSNQLVNWASSTVDSKVSKDDASVMVTKECPNPEPKPTPTPTPEPTPKDIVPTGPESVVVSALGLGGVTTLISYMIASRRKF